MFNLKPCPFCGGEAELKEARNYVTNGWRVMCKKCRIGTLPVWINLPLVTGKGLDESARYTSEQALQIAVDTWNRRIGEKESRVLTTEAITKLIELLRVFINTPCRTKADAKLPEAKLAEFEREVSKPEETGS